jgi:hypothetical protein
MYTLYTTHIIFTMYTIYTVRAAGRGDSESAVPSLREGVGGKVGEMGWNVGESERVSV